VRHVAAPLAFAIAVATSGLANAASSTTPLTPAFAGKMTAAVRQELAVTATNSFMRVIVTLVPQADLDAIGGGTRRARLRATITELQDVADQAQAPLLDQLDAWQNEGLVRRFTPYWIFDGIAVEAVQSVIDEIAARSDVVGVDTDRTVWEPAPATLAAPAGPPEPNVSLINAPAMWDLGFTGQGIVVASMDTGVDATHPDLAASWRGGTNSWFDPYGQHPAAPVDLNGHGTSTTGVMVGRDSGGTSIGVAPDAQWIAVKIFNDQGSATSSGIHAGFQWLLDPDGNPTTPDAPQVVDNSWSLTNPGCDLTFQADLQALASAGILPVFAAGNSGPSAGTSASPSNYPEALAVGATDGSDVVADFSSRGPSTCGGRQSVYPDVMAPGVSVHTTDRFATYTNASGTSLSAPHVAGALALLLDAYPNLPVTEQRGGLTEGAVDLGTTGPDDTYGHGRIDVLAAYNWVTADNVPGAPTNVVATDGNGQATVTWSAPSSDGGSPITGYTVTATPGGQQSVVDGSTLSAVVLGLTNGTSYTFMVVATNAAGSSAPSAPSNAVTPKAVPGAPTNVSAVAANHAATVSWTPPSSNGGSALTGYTLTASPGGATKSVGPAATSTSFTGLTNGTSYTFTIVATNANGSSVPSSPSNAVTPRTVPGAPTNPVATAGNGSASVTWSAPASNGGSAITGYTVTSNVGGFSASVDGSTLTAVVSGLTNGTSYQFRVIATNEAGNGGQSPLSNAVTPKAVPGAPTKVSAVAANHAATVSWTPPSSNGGSALTGYTLTASPGGATKSVGPAVTSTSFTGLTNGTSYTFTVVARNAAGSSAPSGQSNAVTPGNVPGVAANVSAVAGNQMASVAWTAPSSGGSATSYTVTASTGGRSTTVGGSSRSAIVAGLSNGTDYTFTVVAANASGTGQASAASNAATPTSAVSPVVFASNRPGSSGFDIYLMNSDSSGVVRLLGRPGSDTDPALSPDGTRIVFVSGSNATSEIWVMNVDGTGLTRLTNNGFTDRDPNWSPGGTNIVFASNQDGGSDVEIYTMSADGYGVTRLTNNTNSDSLPAWSPDGTKIAFSSNRVSNAETWVMNADDSSPVRLTTKSGTDQAPAWSPDGTKIAFTNAAAGGDTHLFVVNADGQNPTDLSVVSGASNVKDTAPAWSPNGAQLLFASTRAQSPNFDLYRMQRDGTGVLRLTIQTGDDAAPDW
jgi:subtilisin family serine protease